MRMKELVIFVVPLLLVFCSVAYPDVPSQMNYQFRLTDSLGENVPDGNYSVTFVIFNDSIGGDTIWAEGRLVSAKDGLVSVVLGEIVPIPDTTFQGQNRWLVIQVGLDKVIVPTTPHTSPQRQENTSSKKNAIPEYEVVAVIPNGHKLFIVTQATTKSELNSIVSDYKSKNEIPDPPWMINFFSDKQKALRVFKEWGIGTNDDSWLNLWVYRENVDHSAIAQWTSWDGITFDKW